ncbi:MAG: sortase domain-containing protein [Candidatus Limnocylindria bacterium]
MRRFFSAGMVVPLVLALVGVALIIAGQLNLDAPPSSSLPPIPEPTVAAVTPRPTGALSAPPSATATSRPTATPLPANVVAVQLEVDTKPVVVNVRVKKSPGGSNDDFPDECCAFIIGSSSQPGRGTNSYIVAHAVLTPIRLFKPLWNARLGDRLRIRMSNGLILVYRITEIHPNVSCPDDRYPPMPDPPLALQYAPPGCAAGARWTAPTTHERVTLQTSQGFNRNYGELIVVAEPVTS